MLCTLFFGHINYLIMWKKVPLEVKMEALKLLQSGESANAVSKRLSISNGELQTWSLIYAKEGEHGLAVYPKNICIGAIKDKIICTYRQKRVPLHILSAKYSVPYSSVCRCISTYKRKGNAGRAGDHMEDELTKAELKQKLKEALNENEYLKAENALLKKVKALMEAEERRNKRSRKPSSH